MRVKRDSEPVIRPAAAGSGHLFLPLRAEKVEDVLNPRRASGSLRHRQRRRAGPRIHPLIDGVCRDLQAKDLDGAGGGHRRRPRRAGHRGFRRQAVPPLRHRRCRQGQRPAAALFPRRPRRARRGRLRPGERSSPTPRPAACWIAAPCPICGNGLFGRGLFLAVREIAGTTATAAGVVLSSPNRRPGPTRSCRPRRWPDRAEKEKRAGTRCSLPFISPSACWPSRPLGLAWTLLRFSRARGKAARAKVIGGAIVPTILAWIAGRDLFLLHPGLRREFPAAVRRHAGRARAGHGRPAADLPAAQAPPGLVPPPLRRLRRPWT